MVRTYGYLEIILDWLSGKKKSFKYELHWTLELILVFFFTVDCYLIDSPLKIVLIPSIRSLYSVWIDASIWYVVSLTISSRSGVKLNGFNLQDQIGSRRSKINAICSLVFRKRIKTIWNLQSNIESWQE